MSLSSFANDDPRATLSATLSAPSLHAGDRGELKIALDIKPGFHAQSHTPSQSNYIAFKVALDANESVKFGDAIYPPGSVEEYPALGKLNVYTGRVEVRVPLTITREISPGPLTVTGKLTYQICNDQTCFMPAHPRFTANSTGAATTTAPTAATTAGLSGSAGSSTGDNGLTIPVALGIAFIAGLLFNVMPCVLPVLPLKVMSFYEVSQHHRSRSILLGVVFGCGVVAVFSILALLVLILKVFSWGEMFSNAYFIWTIVAILVAMALGLFGVYTVSLPVGAYRFEPRHDTIGGNLLMGMLTAVLATPCTAPLLPGLLLWAVAQPKSVGVASMVTVGIGMAFPYVLLSAFPQWARKFPRTGPGSELFKQMMGFLMLVAAVYFAAGRIVPGPAFWWAVTAAIGIACIYLIVRTVQLMPRLRPIFISAIIAILAFGGSLWWTMQVNGGEANGWTAYSIKRFDSARAGNQLVLVKFTANWCATCQYIEGRVYSDPVIWQALAKHGVVALKADMTDEDSPAKPLLLKLNPAGGIPLTAIFSPSRADPIILSSIYTKQALLSALDQASSSPVAVRD